jgi:drug/metabolite transporter (DMT)-like permease
MLRERTRATAWVGAAITVLAVALVAVAPMHWLKLVGALLGACTAPGAALMAWLDAGDGAAQAGLTIGVSTAAFALIAGAMVWLSQWHPAIVFGAVAAICVCSCLVRLTRSAPE